MREIPLAEVRWKGSFEYISIQEIEVTTRADCHPKAKVSLLVDGELPEEELRMMEGRESVLVLADGSVLFRGTCIRCDVTAQSGYKEAAVQIIAYSHKGDVKKKSRTFQNPGKTLGQMMQSVFTDYDAVIFVEKDEAIPYVIVQKEETDWTFLVRVSNQFRKSVWVDCRKAHLEIHIGNKPFSAIQLGDNAVLLTEEKDLNELRLAQANGMEDQAGYQYMQKTVQTNHALAIAGDFAEKGMIIETRLTAPQAVLHNRVSIRNTKEFLPEYASQTEAAFSSQIQAGKIIAVSSTAIRVQFSVDSGQAVQEAVEIPYESVLSNSFYTMPDLGDQVFVYLDNQGNTICLGSKRTDTADSYFQNPKEKVIGGLDNLIHFRETDLNFTATREKYTNGDEGSQVSLYMKKDTGISIIADSSIRIASDKRIIIAATKKDLKDIYEIRKNKVIEYKQLHQKGVDEYKTKGGDISEMEARKEKWKKDAFENITDGLKDMVFADWWMKKETPELDGTVSNQYEEGICFLFASALELRVGKSFIRFGVDDPKELYIYASVYSWLGSKPAENYPQKADELRDAWEIGMDILTAGLALAGTVCLIVGTGGIAGGVILGMGALVSFSRGDYFGAITSAVGMLSEVGVVTKVAKSLQGLSAVARLMNTVGSAKKIIIVCEMVYGVAQVGYTFYKTIPLMIERMNKQDTLIGKVSELIVGVLTCSDAGASAYNTVNGGLKKWNGSDTSGAGGNSREGGADGAENPGHDSGNEHTGISEDVNDNQGTANKNGEGNENQNSNKNGNENQHKNETQSTKGEKEQNQNNDPKNKDDKINTNEYGNETGAGDPVDVVTGALTVHYTDMIVPDIQEDFKLVRTYRSIHENRGGMLGKRWIYNIESRISRTGPTLSVLLPDIHKEQFVWGDGGWHNQVSGREKYLLTEEEDAYRLFNRETKETFLYQKDGKIRKRMDRNGNRMQYFYQGSQLEKLELASGQELLFSYEKGMVSSVRDASGRECRFDYQGDLLQEMCCTNRGKVNYEYTAEGYLSSITNENGKCFVKNQYDRKGRVVRQMTADGEEYLFFYDEAEKKTTFTTVSNNAVCTYYYNRQKLVERIIYEDGSEKRWKFNACEQVVYERDELGYETFREYSPEGYLLEEKKPSGLICSYRYDKEGNLIEKSDNAGGKTVYGYDPCGNLLTMKVLLNEDQWAVNCFRYDARGRLLEACDARGNKRQWSYDTSYFSASRYVDANDGEIRYDIDPYGRIFTETSDRGTIHYSYNSLNQITSVTDEEGNTTYQSYDAAGKRTRQIRPNEAGDPSAAGIRYIYDPMDHLIRMIDEEEHVHAVQVDSEGRVLKAVNPNTYDAVSQDGEGVRHEYDVRGNRIRTIYPDGSIVRRFFDARKNMVKLILPEEYAAKGEAGAGNTYCYDSESRLICQKDSSGAVKSYYIFDLAGRIIKEINGKGYDSADNDEDRIGTLYRYNAAGWLMEVRTPIEKIKDGGKAEMGWRLVRYDYDANGNQTKEKRYLGLQTLTSAHGKVLTITKEYDRADRLIRVGDSTGAFVEYGYNTHNQRIREKIGINSQVNMLRKYDYDASGRLSRMWESTDRSMGGSLFAETRYQYDRNGNITCITTPLGSRILRSYDRTDRLICERHRSKDGSIDHTIEFAYDPAGNMIRRADSGKREERRVYDVNNRLVLIRDSANGITGFRYDRNGKLKKQIRPNCYAIGREQGAGTEYCYDREGRLTETLRADGIPHKQYRYNRYGELEQITDAAFCSVRIEYDFAGRKTRISTSGKALQQYSYDAFGHVTEVVDGCFNRTSYELDAWGRVEGIRKADESCERYAYDYAGNLIFASDGEGHETHSTFNAMNLPESRTDAEGRTEFWQYDKEGNMVRHTDRNGAILFHTYNMYGNLTGRRDASGSFSESFGYGPDGILLYADGGGWRYEYGYDEAGRLRTKKCKGRTLLSYEYDLNGNRTAMTDFTGKTIRYHYDVNGLLTEVLDQEQVLAKYTYNPDLTRKEQQFGDCLFTSYRYDEDKNLTGMKTWMKDILLFVNLPAPDFFFFEQIKRRYRIN